MENENLMRDYNKAITRMKKAEEFLNGDDPIDRKLKWIDKYNELVREISGYMTKYKKLTGQAMQPEEIFNGFKTIS